MWRTGARASSRRRADGPGPRTGRLLEASAADHRRLLLAYEERDKETAIAVNRLMIMTGYRALQESGLIRAG